MADDNKKFVEAMLKSAKENKESHPRIGFEGVDDKQVDDFMAQLKKGKVPKK